MPHRLICEIHDDIDRAVSKGRIDMVAGLTEEARICGKRMEAKLHEYADLEYDLARARDLRQQIKEYKAEIGSIEESLEIDPHEPKSDWPPPWDQF